MLGHQYRVVQVVTADVKPYSKLVRGVRTVQAHLAIVGPPCYRQLVGKMARLWTIGLTHMVSYRDCIVVEVAGRLAIREDECQQMCVCGQGLMAGMSCWRVGVVVEAG